MDDPDLAAPTTHSALDALHDAIQTYVAESIQGGVVVDWVLSTEVDHGAVNRSFLIWPSKTMTAWKLHGFAYWSHRKLSDLAQRMMDMGQ